MVHPACDHTVLYVYFLCKYAEMYSCIFCGKAVDSSLLTPLRGAITAQRGGIVNEISILFYLRVCECRDVYAFHVRVREFRNDRPSLWTHK